MKHLIYLFVGLVSGIGFAQAASLADTDATLICALVDLASCVPGDGCERETSATINVPSLVEIDQKSQEITGHRPDGGLLSTKIDQATHQQNLLVLDGVQDELSWTITVTEDNGRMSLAAVGDGVAFTAFGSCVTKQ